jgi:hypothetical protein
MERVPARAAAKVKDRRGVGEDLVEKIEIRWIDKRMLDREAARVLLIKAGGG